MKITAVTAISLNGRTTKGDDGNVTAWTSAEDKRHYHNQLESAEVLIMGSGTYDLARTTLPKDEGKLIIVLTTDPAKYDADTEAGSLEFTSGKPLEIVNGLADRGYKTALLLGGAFTNKDFYASKLVDELWLTVEPKLFGSGKPLTETGDYFLDAKLSSVKQINNSGTLLLHYTF